MDIHAYLKRLNYRTALAPSPQSLRDLQLAHLRTVPFENLSIHAHEPIVLADDALFNKIVVRRRGGFCYELNGLFAALLRALGFEVTMLAAGVTRKDGTFSPFFDHMTLLVSLKERWLVDVGFGDTFRKPLLLNAGGVLGGNGRYYKIIPDGQQYTLLEQKAGESWEPQYRFTLQAYQYADYTQMCHHNQTSPDSHFTKERICTRATAQGRLTLSGYRFIQTTLKGNRQERMLADEKEYAQILQEHFGIVI